MTRKLSWARWCYGTVEGEVGCVGRSRECSGKWRGREITRAGEGERDVVQLAKEGERWWDGRCAGVEREQEGQSRE